NRVAVVFEGAPLLAGVRVPQLDEAVVAAGGQGVAVGAEGQAEDDVVVGADDDFRLVNGGATRREEVDAHHAGGAGRTAGHGEAAAVAAESQRRHLAVLPRQPADHVAGRRVDEGHLVLPAGRQRFGAGAVRQGGNRGRLRLVRL